MKERVASPIALEASPQVVPPLNLMYRLMLDQSLENQRRRPPVNPLHDEEAAVEPRAEQVQQVGFDDSAVRVLGDGFQKVRTHLDERARSTRGRIEPAKQLLTTRLRGHMEIVQSC